MSSTTIGESNASDAILVPVVGKVPSPLLRYKRLTADEETTSKYPSESTSTNFKSQVRSTSSPTLATEKFAAPSFK